MARIIDTRHPSYTTANFAKYRATMVGGASFISAYLKKFTDRESETEFTARKEATYVPAFAKEAILDIQNSISERLVDIIRLGGPKSYTDACLGLNYGVDRLCSTMNDFINRSILPELLPIGKVGVFVDRPSDPGQTLADSKSPYIYSYKAEDILAWTQDIFGKYTALLLKSEVDDVDPVTGLTKGLTEEYRLYVKGASVVMLTTYDKDGNQLSTSVVQLPEIPFVLFDIGQSLLVDVADYQIGLMNLASSDMAYAIKANFPFYTEQFSPQADWAGRQVKEVPSSDGQATTSHTAAAQVKTGPTVGRRYPMGAERPGFIHPSPEPLRVSMEKQEAMKQEIRQLLHLALTTVSSKLQSADSKQRDNQGLEAGLSAIGAMLAKGEREIALHWANYESGKAAEIAYPAQYTLRSEEERLSEAKDVGDIIPKIPSLTYQKELAKRIANLTVGPRAGIETLNKIISEIDAAKVVSIDPDVMKSDHEAGFVSTETASKARLYPEGEVEQAKKDHAERATRIAIAQSKATNAAARGNDDQSADSDEAKREKMLSQSADSDPSGKKAVRS